MKLEFIYIDWNNPKSIKEAEKKKAILENKGYELSFSTPTTLTYKKH
ncbi:MAG: hypothetical protein KDD03_09235 [Gelidibacter sp.]|nr:hypothetical protein [Gelidibacter sp.]